MPEHDFVVVTIAYGDKAKAQTAASELVQKRLAACGQISEITSTYRWKGEVLTDPEYLLTLKTNRTCLPGIRNFVKKTHDYDTAEILATPVIWFEDRYGDWIEANTTRE